MLVAGCPVYNRGWILDKWFEAMEGFIEPNGYAFVYTPGDDDTFAVICHWQAKTGKKVTVIKHSDGVHGNERDWTNQGRIETLAIMRNMLMDHAAEIDADLLSVDSDVVLQGPGFVHHYKEFDVFGPTVALATDRTIINGFSHRRPDGWTVRAKPGHHGAVDVLCAAMYIQRDVVQDERARFAYHPRGEDFGFAENVKNAGYTMGLCDEITLHYMHKDRPPIIPNQ